MRYVIKQLEQDMKMYNNFQSLNRMSDEFIEMIDKICNELEIDKAIFYKDHIDYIRDMLSRNILDNLITNKENQTNTQKFDDIKKIYDTALEEVATCVNIIKKGNHSDSIKKLANLNISGLYLKKIISNEDKIELIFENMSLEFSSVTKLDIKNYKEDDLIGKVTIKAIQEELFLNEDNTYEYNILFDEGELSVVFSDMKYN